MEHAALAWGLTYGKESVKCNREFAASIYYSAGAYSFTETNIGDGDSVYTPLEPKGTVKVAAIHSHADYDPNLRRGNIMFSRDDKKNAETRNNKKGLPSFLVTMDGRLQVYIPYSTSYELSNQLYRSPNMPFMLKER